MLRSVLTRTPSPQAAGICSLSSMYAVGSSAISPETSCVEPIYGSARPISRPTIYHAVAPDCSTDVELAVLTERKLGPMDLSHSRARSRHCLKRQMTLPIGPPAVYAHSQAAVVLLSSCCRASTLRTASCREPPPWWACSRGYRFARCTVAFALTA